MKKAKNIILAMCLTVAAFCLVACGNTITLKLSTSNNVLTIKPGESLQFATEIQSKNAEDKSKTVDYNLVAGSSIATINASGLLSVNSNAVPGNEIKVRSELGSVKSNVVTIVVSAIPLESISISSNKTNVSKGGYANITAVLNPENTTQKNIEWIFIEGNANASIVNNRLLINDDAETGATIKIKAMVGSIESNVLTFTVDAQNTETYFISFTNESLVLDIKDTNASLIAKVYNANFEEVNNKELEFDIVEGEDLIELIPNGYSCGFKILGNGTAKVSATIKNTNISEEATIKVIVPPDALKLPEVFTERSNYEYSFSNVDKLPFAVSVINNKACQDVKYSFEKNGVKETIEGEFATYADGKIQFNTTGKVKVVATSNSGSKQEVSTNYTFNVNDGINVYNFEELKATMLSGSEKPINIVVLNKIVANGADFGYDIVPAIILNKLNNGVLEDLNALVGGAVKLYAGGSVTINGNNHTIDISKLRVMTKNELMIAGLSDGNYQMSSFLNVESLSNYNVNINDLTLKGNCPIDFAGDLNGHKAIGVHSRGIQIGSGDLVTNVPKLKNVTLTGFNVGIRISHANYGSLENVTVENCYGSGIQLASSIIELKNITYGICGAAGIELTPDDCDKAGSTFDQPQKVTFAGTITTSNYNNGQTVYLKNYMNGAVPTIINGLLAGLSDDKKSNVVNPNGEFVFIAFMFHNVDGALNIVDQNDTILNYSNFDENGIIDMKDVTGIDTTHQYITMDVIYGGVKNLGKILVYNHNYIPA